MKKYLNYWLPLLIWAAIIFAFSSYPTAKASEIQWQDFVVKKTFHIIEYGILATVTYRALRGSGVDEKKAGIYSMIFALVYGATDEFHQSFTSGRDAKLRDVIFDTIGGVLAIYTIWKLLPKAPKKLQSLAKKLQVI